MSGNGPEVPTSPGRPALWRVLALVALLTQTALLYWPRAAGPETGLPLDKVAHFLMFAGVAALATLAGVALRWTAAILVLQAMASEAVQHYVLPGRSGDWGDLTADLLGIAAGIALVLTWRAAAEQRR
jgi:VanZ family protein